MTKAIILSAGQGKRLLPLTEHCPKCLLTVKDKPVLAWQIEALLDTGISEVNVVTGFHAELVDTLIENRFASARVNALFNPFFDVSDNLASCWMARYVMDDDFLLINGDTLFERAILDTVLNSPTAPITLTIDSKSAYDDDDMKVELNGMQVRHVSKTLTLEHTHAESIGMLYFRGKGPQLFRNALEETMRLPAGLKSWFLAVIDSLAGKQMVNACPINGLRWAELDFVGDLETANTIFDDE